VFVLGHSWGRVLGLRLAAAHPEWLHAYIGMGQATDAPESERRGWAWTLKMARRGADFEAAAINLSPEYGDEDVRNAFAGQPPVTDALLRVILTADLSTIGRLEVPLLLLLGRHDVNVSSEVAAEWFASVRAPAKRLVWFERSAHHLTSEEPGKLLHTLITYARPIAAQAGDVAPP
jgi:pimeloyl-ACP methyl ester carboxylesterase